MGKETVKENPLKGKRKVKPKSTDNKYFDYYRNPTGAGQNIMVLNEHGLDTVKKLSAFGTPITEICVFLGCDTKTVYTEYNREIFQEAYQNGKSLGNINLRRSLHERSTKGKSDACLIFSCKSILGLNDRQTPSYDESTLDGLVRALDGIKDDDDEGE